MIEVKFSVKGEVNFFERFDKNFLKSQEKISGEFVNNLLGKFEEKRKLTLFLGRN